MAGDCSFDIVSQFDEQELVNAVDQTRREVKTRYDLKDTKTEIVSNQDNITILTDSSLTLKNVRERGERRRRESAAGHSVAAGALTRPC